MLHKYNISSTSNPMLYFKLKETSIAKYGFDLLFNTIVTISPQLGDNSINLLSCVNTLIMHQHLYPATRTLPSTSLAGPTHKMYVLKSNSGITRLSLHQFNKSQGKVLAEVVLELPWQNSKLTAVIHFYLCYHMPDDPYKKMAGLWSKITTKYEVYIMILQIGSELPPTKI